MRESRRSLEKESREELVEKNRRRIRRRRRRGGGGKRKEEEEEEARVELTRNLIKRVSDQASLALPFSSVERNDGRSNSEQRTKC